MLEDTLLPFSLPSVQRKKVTAAFDGGRMTSDGGVMLLASIETSLGIAARLAPLITDPRNPAFVTHSVADILRARMLAIACGYEDGDDLDHLRTDPGFKLACGRLPDSGRDLCSQPTVSRWENAPDLREVIRLTYAMVDLYCASYPRPPHAVTLDIDDTVDVVHGHQQLSLFNAHYDERCFLPIHVYDTATSRPVAVLLRPGTTPSGAEVRNHLRRLVRRIRQRWPNTRLTIRGDGHYGRPEVMAWCEANGVDYILGLPGNKVLDRLVEADADDVRVRRAEAQAPVVLLNLDLAVPDHTTLSRRGSGLARQKPTLVPHGAAHLLTDSTGLKLFGQGEWNAEKHGRARRSWRKLHLAVDADTGEIVASTLTDIGGDDSGQVPVLLDQVAGEVACVTADGADDGDPVYRAVARRQPHRPPTVFIPPRSSAVPCSKNANTPSQRDRHIQLLAQHGRMGWQNATGYGRRSLVETAMGRYKSLIAPALRERSMPTQRPTTAHGAKRKAAGEIGGKLRSSNPVAPRDRPAPFRHLAAVARCVARWPGRPPRASRASGHTRLSPTTARGPHSAPTSMTMRTEAPRTTRKSVGRYAASIGVASLPALGSGPTSNRRDPAEAATGVSACAN